MERQPERIMHILQSRLDALQSLNVKIRARIAQTGEPTTKRCYVTNHRSEPSTPGKALELHDPRNNHRSFVFKPGGQLVTVREINFHAGGGGGFVW
jgi:hypothetical protein